MHFTLKPFPVIDAPHIPPPPSRTLWKVYTVTDSSPAVTCLIAGEM